MLVRTGTVLGGALSLVLMSSSSVWADPDFFGGAVECGSSGGPGCEVTVESQSSPGPPSEPRNDGSGNVPQSGDDSQQATSEAPSAPCEVLDSRTQRCSTTVSSAGSGEEDGVTEDVDYEAIAYAARAGFALPSPNISMSPSGDVPILVRVPVWMWIPSGDWRTESATASVPGGSVTVTATPSSVDWQMGDGTTVSCEGPGTAYDPRVHDPDADSPDCGHTYTTASAENDVTAHMTWEVSWASTDGDGGDLPVLTTTSSEQVRVIESSGVVT